MASFLYSTSSNRYYNKTTGRFVGRVEVRKELDTIIDSSGLRMKNWTTELKDGYMSIAEWQQLMSAEIKSLHMTMASAANGGWSQMSDSDWKRVETYVADQYDYLKGFATSIYTGSQLPNGTMGVRATLYAEAARQTYEMERRLIETEAGATQERNILGGSDHCVECVDLTSEGWVEIGSLPDIGLRICQARCHCTIIYRKGPNDKLGSTEERF